MTIKILLDTIKANQNCKVYSSKGFPILNKHILPGDLYEFYMLCGGVRLFENEEYGIEIIGPEEFILANPVIVGEACEDDITGEWYIIAKDRDGDYLTIDLNKNRLGRCYDSFYDRHGVVGECPIIALSFGQLLEKLIESKGGYWYWLEENFISLGDAYD